MGMPKVELAPSIFKGYDKVTDSNGKILKFFERDTEKTLAAIRVTIPEGSIILTPREQWERGYCYQR